MKTNTNASKEDPHYALPKYNGPPELENEFLGYWRQATDLEEVEEREHFAWIRLFTNKERTPQQKKAILAAEPRFKQWLNGADPGVVVDPDSLNGKEQSDDDKLFQELLSKYGKALRTAKELKGAKLTPRAPILGEWLCEGDLGFIFGVRGSGKSWLVDALATHISNGLDLENWKSHGPFPVLYIDGEMPQDATRDRICGLAEANDNLIILHHEHLFDTAAESMDFTNPVKQRVLLELCLRHNIKVLILDNLSCLLSGLKENDADDWNQVLSWLLKLRRHRIATIIVHHAGRSGFMRGTTKREDPASWMIKVNRIELEPGQEGARFETSFEKPSRNTQNPQWPQAWHFKTEANGEVSIGCKEYSFNEKILQCIQDGLGSVKDLMDELKSSKRTVQRALKKLVADKIIEIQGSGRSSFYVPRGFIK